MIVIPKRFFTFRKAKVILKFFRTVLRRYKLDRNPINDICIMKRAWYWIHGHDKLFFPVLETFIVNKEELSECRVVIYHHSWLSSLPRLSHLHIFDSTHGVVYRTLWTCLQVHYFWILNISVVSIKLEIGEYNVSEWHRIVLSFRW